MVDMHGFCCSILKHIIFTPLEALDEKMLKWKRLRGTHPGHISAEQKHGILHQVGSLRFSKMNQFFWTK